MLYLFGNFYIFLCLDSEKGTIPSLKIADISPQRLLGFPCRCRITTLSDSIRCACAVITLWTINIIWIRMHHVQMLLLLRTEYSASAYKASQTWHDSSEDWLSAFIIVHMLVILTSIRNIWPVDGFGAVRSMSLVEFRPALHVNSFKTTQPTFSSVYFPLSDQMNDDERSEWLIPENHSNVEVLYLRSLRLTSYLCTCEIDFKKQQE